MHTKTILITGASRGIGRATADLLAGRGHRVFGTSRHPAPQPHDAFAWLPLDVTDDASVRACVGTLLDRAGHLDVLINNAGVWQIAALEETTIDRAQHLFDVNLFGVMRMVHAVLPTMRQRRAGQIINLGSLAGVIPLPYVGLYSATKAALEAYTSALRGELRPFGIAVSIIDPDDIHTSMETHEPDIPIPDYVPTRTRTTAVHAQNMAAAPGPELVAQAIAGIVQSDRPKQRYCVGPHAYTVTLKRFLPNSAGAWILRQLYKL